MALPTGLLSPFVFLVTVGVSSLATAVAHVRSRAGTRPFGLALWDGFGAVAVVYLAGVAAVWTAVGGSLWEVPALLLAVGVAAAVLFVALPLLVGRRIVAAATAADGERALRYATYGWPAAMLVVYAVFVAPGGLADGHLFDLDGAAVCLAGFCGIPVPLVAAVAVQVVVALVGPGVFGVAVRAAATRQGRYGTV